MLKDYVLQARPDMYNNGLEILYNSQTCLQAVQPVSTDETV
jgi:hypothetical protein